MPAIIANSSRVKSHSYGVEQVAVSILQREAFNVDSLKKICASKGTNSTFKTLAQELARDLSKGQASNLKALIREGFSPDQLTSIMNLAGKNGTLSNAVKALTMRPNEIIDRARSSNLNPKQFVTQLRQSNKSLESFLTQPAIPTASRAVVQPDVAHEAPTYSVLGQAGFHSPSFGILMGACMVAPQKFSQGTYDKLLKSLMVEVRNPQSGINQLLLAGVHPTDIANLIAKCKGGRDLVNAPEVVSQNVQQLLVLMNTFNLTFKGCVDAFVGNGPAFSPSLKQLLTQVGLPMQTLANEVGFTTSQLNLMLDMQSGRAKSQIKLLSDNKATLSLIPKAHLSEATVKIREILTRDQDALTSGTQFQALVAEYLSADAVKQLFSQRIGQSVNQIQSKDWDPSPWNGRSFEPIDDSSMSDFLEGLFTVEQNTQQKSIPIRQVMLKVASAYRSQVVAVNRMLKQGADPDQVVSRLQKADSMLRNLAVAIKGLSTPGQNLLNLDRNITFAVDQQTMALKGYSDFEVEERIEQMYRNAPHLEKLPEHKREGLVKLLNGLLENAN